MAYSYHLFLPSLKGWSVDVLMNMIHTQIVNHAWEQKPGIRVHDILEEFSRERSQFRVFGLAVDVTLTNA